MGRHRMKQKKIQKLSKNYLTKLFASLVESTVEKLHENPLKKKTIVEISETKIKICTFSNSYVIIRVHKGSKVLSPYTGYYVKDMRKEFIENESKNKVIHFIAFSIYMEHRQVLEQHVTPLASYMLIMSQVLSPILKKLNQKFQKKFPQKFKFYDLEPGSVISFYGPCMSEKSTALISVILERSPNSESFYDKHTKMFVFIIYIIFFQNISHKKYLCRYGKF